MLTSSPTTAPLLLFNELLLAGRPPIIEDFCAQYPQCAGLKARIESLLAFRDELTTLAPIEEDEAWEPPERVGNYRVLAPLGEGGLGKVYVAEQIDPYWLVGLQFMPTPRKEDVEQFRRQLKLVRSFSHPGIAAVHGFGIDQGVAYLASELVHGFSLAQLLKVAQAHRGDDWELDWLLTAMARIADGTCAFRMAEAEGGVATIAALILSAADALGYLHSRGAIHREIRPSNIMVTFEGTPTLVDVGYALLSQVGQRRRKASDSFISSIAYAAPEQTRDAEKEIGPWTDVYGLGATLFHLVVGRRLAPAELEQPPSARSQHPGVTRNIDAAIGRALHPDISRRFKDGADFAKALRPRMTVNLQISGARAPGRNNVTSIAQAFYEREAPPSGQAVFHDNFARLKARYEALPAGHVLVAAFCKGKKPKIGMVDPKKGGTGRVAIIGRHTQAAYRLIEDPTIPLRHSVLITSLSKIGPTFRLLDLKTGQGFEVAGIGRCEAVASRGTLVVRIGSYWLFFLGAGKPWPNDPKAAFARIASVVVRDRRRDTMVSSIDGYSLPPEAAANPEEARRMPSVFLDPGVASLTTAPETDEGQRTIAGKLFIGRQSGKVTCPVYEDELARGLLLGRYDRCDVGSADLWEDESVSRVHLLLVKAGGTIRVIDTASTNGTMVDGAKISISKLTAAATIELGDVEMRWKPAGTN